MLTAFLVVALAQSINLRDEGSSRGWVRAIDCTGSGIACTVDTSTRVGTIAITSTGGGGLPDGGGVGADIPVITFEAKSELTSERVLSAGQYTVIDLVTNGQAQVDWVHGLTCSSGQALTSSGTTAMACTSTLTASDVACSGTCIADSEIAAVAGSKVSGAVATATALAADPTACGAGTYVTDLSAAGALSCSTPAGTYALPDSTSGVTGGIRLTGDLAGTATSPSVVDDSHNHGSSTIAALDVSDTTTGTWSQARGGTGAAALTCTATEGLTSNGTTYSCRAIAADISAASFITKVAESGLSNEFALGSLGTGLLINSTTTGVPTIMSSQTCTNQFARSSTASGTWTCAGLGVADFTANQGTTAQVLHGNAAGQPTWGNVATADLGANVIAIANGGTNSTATPTNGGITYGTGTAQAYSAAGTSGQILTSTGAGAPGWKSMAQLIRVSGSNFTTTSATAVNVTGLSITTAAGTPYMFQCLLDTTGSATGGPRATVTLTTSTATSMAYSIRSHTTAATTLLYTGGSASGTLSATCTSACLTTDIPIAIEGMVNVNANSGTLTIGVANGTAGQTTTVKIGSYCIWWTP
jgi:hypothetical protein